MADKDRQRIGWAAERQDSGYSKLRATKHDTVGWLHPKDGDATTKPNFDLSAPWRKPNAKLRKD